ncbi:MAG: tetratricopeptide repeat protein [Maricaulaceae bacterium]
MPFRHFVSSFLPLAVITVAALGSCNTSAQTSDVVDGRLTEGKLFGEYLAGTYANYLDDAQARSSYYAKAYSRLPENVNLGRRAVTSALTAGDIKLAYTLAAQVNKADEDEPMADAVLGAKAMAAGKYKRSLKSLDVQTADLTVSIMMHLIKGWAQMGAKDVEAARKTFKNLPGGGYFTRFGLLQTAELEIQQGEFEAAHDALVELEAQGTRTLDLEMHLTKARLLCAKGDLDGALKMLEAYSADNGSFETGPVRAAIEQLKTGRPLDHKFTPQELASRALTQPAYGFFAQNRALDAAEVFLRIALTLDPNYHKGKLWTGDVLAAYDRNEEALAFYDQVPLSSPYYVSSRLSEGYLYVRHDEDEKALSVFEEVNESHPSFVTRDALGRAHLSEENYEAAIPIYEALVASLTEDELSEDPQALYLRGICYERVGEWEKAVVDFQRVLAVKPNDADALNYLGYTWVDRGENLEKAFAMIRKAVELEPSSGAIVDSLGWAHYKLGQYDEAKENLEKAVVLSPSSATIIDHLGDVYWKLGRKNEAGYQWERALNYDPTDKEREDIAAKLKGGLSAVQPAP